MPRNHERRSLINGQPYSGSDVVTGRASDQPGAVPILADAPALSELPTDDGTGEPVGLIYVEQGTGTVKVSTPDGSGGVQTGSLLDLSANVSLGSGDITGLL